MSTEPLGYLDCLQREEILLAENAEHKKVRREVAAILIRWEDTAGPQAYRQLAAKLLEGIEAETKGEK